MLGYTTIKNQNDANKSHNFSTKTSNLHTQKLQKLHILVDLYHTKHSTTTQKTCKYFIFSKKKQQQKTTAKKTKKNTSKVQNAKCNKRCFRKIAKDIAQKKSER